MSEVEKYEREGGQYSIPKRLNGLALEYNLVTWAEALSLYQLSVQAVLIIYQVDTLCKTPFGIGYSKVEKKFKQLLEETQERRLKQKKDYEDILKIMERYNKE